MTPSLATVEPVGVRTCVPPPAGIRRRQTTITAVRIVVMGFAAAIVALVAAAPAAAQDSNNLREISPANGVELEESPTVITMSFDQEIADDHVPTVDLSCGGQPQATGLPEVDGDGLVVTATVTNPLPATTCLIAYSLRDGLGNNLVIGTSSFRVLNDPPSTTAAAAESGDTAAPPTTDPFIRAPANPATTGSVGNAENQGSTGGAVWFGRLLSTIGILVIFGGLTIISVGWPEGPEYLVTVRFFRFAWAIALVGTLIYLIAFAAQFNDSSFGAAMSPSSWLDLTDAGWAGRGALLRLVLVIACWYVVSRPEHIIDPATAMWGWGIPLATVAAAALTRVEGSLAALGYLVNVVHLLAAGVWVGGAALVSRVVLAGPGEDDLVQATRAFSKVSMPAIVVVSVTGIFQVWRLDGADLFGSNHGRVLLLKVIVVAVMLAVALAARQQVTMRLDRAHELTAPLADRFKRAFGTEAALGVVVLAFSGWMLTLTPPKVDPLANEVFLDAMVFVHEPTGLDATVRVGPGLAGPTGLRVDVESPDEGISRLLLRFIPPENSGAFIVEQEIPLTGAGTAYLDDSIGLPLNAAGVWTLELSASTATGVLENARYTFELRLPDGTQVTTTAPQVTVDVNISIVEQTTTTAPFATTTAAPTTVP
jgi:copper transport protein